MEFPLAKGIVFLDILPSGTNELRILLDRNELGTQNLNVPREPSHLPVLSRLLLLLHTLSLILCRPNRAIRVTLLKWKFNHGT